MFLRWILRRFRVTGTIFYFFIFDNWQVDYFWKFLSISTSEIILQKHQTNIPKKLWQNKYLTFAWLFSRVCVTDICRANSFGKKYLHLISPRKALKCWQTRRAEYLMHDENIFANFHQHIKCILWRFFHSQNEGWRENCLHYIIWVNLYRNLCNLFELRDGIKFWKWSWKKMKLRWWNWETLHG